MEHVDVLIVGAGLSGIGMGCHLRRKQPARTFVILEGRETLGGTWDLFRYPGVRSDSDMYTFGFAFKPWVEDQDIATGESILRYLHETVDEYGLRPSIRFSHRVTRVRWRSDERRWIAEVHRTDDDSRFELSADFLVTCTGYYNYARGHRPEWEGFDEYRGVVAYPQHWPEDLDYAGKRVLIIGSGATAVTLVPAMAPDAAHVTMLQRSPSYIFSRPGEDAIARGMRKVLPEKVAHTLARVKNVAMGQLVFTLSQRAPDKVRGLLRQMAEERVGPDVDVDVHFNPKYDPWDQRLCLIPDDDLYEALRSGEASIVTDHIARFTATGVELASGERLEADLVVPATGLELQFGGGMELSVDGRAIEPGELVSYRGVMFGGVPNWVAIIGYTSASWTLKADLAADYVCRLLRYMDEEGYDTVVPRLDDPSMPTRPIMANLASAGYVKRAAHRMPKQGAAAPWVNADNYLRDLLGFKLRGVADRALEFTQSPARRRPKRFGFAGKTAVVTGAASGIGEALAKALAQRGAGLVLVDLDEARLEATATDARRHGVEVETHVLDMGDAAAVERFGAELAARRPDVDVLINNAGVALGGNVEHLAREDVEWLMNINFYGVVHLTRALLPALRARPDAYIANVSSVFGLVAPPGQASYAASKFAVRGFSEALRRELRGTTVDLSVIHPGGVQTEIARNARVAAAVEVDDLEREIAAMEKHFITPPAKAAEVILDGVARRRARILVGPDAHLIEWLERLFPTRNVEALAKLLGLGEPPRVKRRVPPPPPEIETPPGEPASLPN